MQERRVGELLGDRRHGVHVAERGADDEVEALAREAPEDLLGVGALGHELDVGDVAVGHVLADVLEALVVGLAPATVVMWPDEDHRDVELALLDVGDLQVGTALGAGAGAVARRCDAAEPAMPLRMPRPMPLRMAPPGCCRRRARRGRRGAAAGRRAQAPNARAAVIATASHESCRFIVRCSSSERPRALDLLLGTTPPAQRSG